MGSIPLFGTMELEEIRQKIQEYLNIPKTVTVRRVTLRTGVGGMDMFEEAMENQVGLQRIYIGYKVPRILRILQGEIKKSHSGRYYKLVGNGKVFQDGKWRIS